MIGQDLFEVLYIILDKKKVTAVELASHFAVSTRTIYRWVEQLCVAGIPLYMTKGRGGGISVSDGTGDAEYTVNRGGYVIISSAEEHSYQSVEAGTRVFYVEFGSGLLNGGFSELSGRMFSAMPDNQKIGGLLRRMSDEYNTPEPERDWVIRSSLYEIAVLLRREVQCFQRSANGENRLSRLKAIYPALEYIANSYAEPISIDDAARATHYEKTAFCRAFKSLIGLSFHKYLNIYRIEQASRLIETGMYKLGEAAKECGIEQPKTFARLFREYMGMTATEYRDRCKAKEIS